MTFIGVRRTRKVSPRGGQLQDILRSVPVQSWLVPRGKPRLPSSRFGTICPATAHASGEIEAFLGKIAPRSIVGSYALQAAVKYEEDDLAGAKSLLDRCVQASPPHPPRLLTTPTHSSFFAAQEDPETQVNSACITYKEGKYDEARAKFQGGVRTGLHALLGEVGPRPLCEYRRCVPDPGLHVAPGLQRRPVPLLHALLRPGPGASPSLSTMKRSGEGKAWPRCVPVPFDDEEKRPGLWVLRAWARPADEDAGAFTPGLSFIFAHPPCLTSCRRT